MPGFPVLNFDISRDGRQVVMEAPDNAGRERLWLAALDHSAPLRQIPNVEGGQPHFGPAGEILFRHNEEASTADGSLGFVYRVLSDGTGLQKAFEQPVSIFNFPSPVSPDGRSVFAWAPLPGDGPGGRPGVFARRKAADHSSAAMDKSVGELGERCCRTMRAPEAFYFPLAAGQTLPRIPAGGFRSSEEIARLPGGRRIEGRLVTLGPAPDVYAFYRGNTQRNLYRIPDSVERLSSGSAGRDLI